MKDWMKKLEMDELEDMAYLDTFCDLMEMDEAVPEDVFYLLLSEVQGEELKDLMDQYLEEVMSGISEDCIGFYTLMSSYRRSFRGMSNYLIQEDKRERIVGELFRFREWYRDPEKVFCTDLAEDREFAASVCESLMLGRMEKLSEGSFRFDFDGAMDLVLEEYEEYQDDEEEDWTEWTDDDPRLTLIDELYPVIDEADPGRNRKGEGYLQ